MVINRVNEPKPTNDNKWTNLFSLLTPMAIHQWSWTEQDAILYLGLYTAANAVLAGFCFATIGPLSKRFDER